MQDLMLVFDGEKIKRTHYTGNFNISSIKIGKKIIETSTTTAFYDFRDFASESYINGFSDIGVDIDGDGK